MPVYGVHACTFFPQVLPSDLRVTKEAMLKIVCICSVNQFGVGEPASGTDYLSFVVVPRSDSFHAEEQRTESAGDGGGSGLFLNSAIISHRCAVRLAVRGMSTNP